MHEKNVRLWHRTCKTRHNGFGTERARLGTFRGFGTERARLDTFRVFGIGLLALRAVRHFLKNLKIVSFFYSKRASSPPKTEVLPEKQCLFLLKKTSQPRKKQKFCMKKWQKIDKKRYQKEHPPPQKREFLHKKMSFFTQKEHPASQKIEVLHEKMTKNWQKKVPKRAPSPAKTWSFAWKIENRPTSGDFEKKILNPQLHQIFKPIRKIFCTFLPI